MWAFTLYPNLTGIQSTVNIGSNCAGKCMRGNNVHLSRRGRIGSEKKKIWYLGQKSSSTCVPCIQCCFLCLALKAALVCYHGTRIPTHFYSLVTTALCPLGSFFLLILASQAHVCVCEAWGGRQRVIVLPKSLDEQFCARSWRIPNAEHFSAGWVE